MAEAQVRRIMARHHETRNDLEPPMNHHETIVLAEQHRAELIDEAAALRRTRRLTRHRSRRHWFGRRPDAA
jgi:hypothetical protein